jgi:hypothetical protein
MELLLLLAVHRGSLAHILRWIETASSASDVGISVDVVGAALVQIRTVTGLGTGGFETSPHMVRFRTASAEHDHVDLHEAVYCLLAEVRYLSSNL